MKISDIRMAQNVVERPNTRSSVILYSTQTVILEMPKLGQKEYYKISLSLIRSLAVSSVVDLAMRLGTWQVK